jgi:hypothetical protein
MIFVLHLVAIQTRNHSVPCVSLSIQHVDGSGRQQIIMAELGALIHREISAWSAAGPRLKDASQNCEKHSPVIYELTPRHSDPRAALK